MLIGHCTLGLARARRERGREGGLPPLAHPTTCRQNQTATKLYYTAHLTFSTSIFPNRRSEVNSRNICPGARRARDKVAGCALHFCPSLPQKSAAGPTSVVLTVDHLSDAKHEIPAVRDNPCVNIAKYTSDGSDRKEEGGGDSLTRAVSGLDNSTMNNEREKVAL